MTNILGLDQIKSFLKNFSHCEDGNQRIEDLREFLRRMKKDLVGAGKQNEAKEIWCLEQVLEIQEKYLGAFKQMRQGDFYKAWCSLEQCEITLGFLCPHFSSEYEQYGLNFIDKVVRQYQSLFPYKASMSPEFLEIEKKCDICDKVVSIRNGCGHRIGEIYNGKMCCRIVTKIEFLGMAIVESPLQKYSVPFVVNKKSGESEDKHDYRLIQNLISKLKTPFDEWDASWTEKIHPHSKFKDIGRNGKCPCGSGKKYKKCCLEKLGVLMPHCLFKIPGMQGYEENIF